LEFTASDFIFAGIGSILLPGILVFSDRVFGKEIEYIAPSLSIFSLNPGQVFQFSFFLGLLFFEFGLLACISEFIFGGPFGRGADFSFCGPPLLAGC
jgi:hypothetical protein